MSPSETLVDNRRLVVRLASHQILNMLGELADRLGMDLIETLVHGAVWTANTEHLLESTGRYARLLDLPPDSLRRPIGEAQLLARLRLPRPLLESNIERLIERGYLERVGAGLVVPSAVFTRPEMVDALAACYAAVTGMTQTVGRLAAEDGA